MLMGRFRCRGEPTGAVFTHLHQQPAKPVLFFRSNPDCAAMIDTTSLHDPQEIAVGLGEVGRIHLNHSDEWQDVRCRLNVCFNCHDVHYLMCLTLWRLFAVNAAICFLHHLREDRQAG